MEKMRYFLLRGENTERYPECSIPQNDPWFDEDLTFGRAIKTVHELPIKYQVSNNMKLNDYPYGARWFVISNKFAAVLRQLTDEYQEFPSSIYRKSVLLADDYTSFVFTTSYPVLSLERSKYREYGYGVVLGLTKTVLDGRKLKDVRNNIEIFRMTESIGTIILTENGKNRIVEAGITGVDFEEAEVV